MAEFTTEMLLAKVQELLTTQFEIEWEEQKKSIGLQSVLLEKSIARVERASAMVLSTTEALIEALQKRRDRFVKALPKFRQRLNDFKSTTGVDLLSLDPSRINWRKLERQHGLQFEERQALRRAVIWINESSLETPSLSEEERLRLWAGDQWVAWNATKEELEKAESEARWLDDSIERICPPPSPKVIQSIEDIEDVDNDILDQLVDWLEANQPECVEAKYEHKLGSTWREVRIHLPDGNGFNFELD